MEAAADMDCTLIDASGSHNSEVDSHVCCLVAHTHHWRILDSLNFNIFNVLILKDLCF